MQKRHRLYDDSPRARLIIAPGAIAAAARRGAPDR
jgi:hypothetical protein